MKGFITAIAILVIIALAYINWGGARTATSDELKATERELARRIDSLSAKLDTLQTSVNRIDSNVDTLKKGQVIIFDEVKKQPMTLWELINF
ncbi:MAG: DUF1664 domain-containing protein [Bacteroidales bacterium]|nr:DUF1664 domain-containing protein [Bacteroidales bacterium]